MTGLIALVLAMGVGRFAFTPMLPLMQNDAGLSLAQGGWLASANYLGYLLGALTVARVGFRAATLIRIGMVLIVVTTLGMGLAADPAAHIALRFVAGVASAWLLVSVSFWALGWLHQARRPELGSTVFAGVGVGIVLVGLTCMLLAGWTLASATVWLVLGGMSLILAGSIWNDFTAPPCEPPADPASGRPHGGARHWRLVLCYGAFGLGYILPATFLPALARELVSDPRVFGLAWPVFGFAAVVSTVLASRLPERITRRQIWSYCHLVMALGVALPVFWPHAVAIAVAASCVGGTFMVITMVGLQEARAVAGEHARHLMAAMTAAFATGQVLGPLLVVMTGGSLDFALLLAVVSLVVSAAALRNSSSSLGSTTSRRST